MPHSKTLRKRLKARSSEAIKAKTEALQEAIYPISTALYQKAQEQAQQAAGGAGSTDAKGPDETVVDADYEVVDDEKRK